MLLTTKFALQMVATKCLQHFFEEITPEDILKISKESKSFERAASYFERRGLQGNPNHVTAVKMYEMYFNLDIAAQTLVLQRAYELHEERVFKEYGI